MDFFDDLADFANKLTNANDVGPVGRSSVGSVGRSSVRSVSRSSVRSLQTNSSYGSVGRPTRLGFAEIDPIPDDAFIVYVTGLLTLLNIAKGVVEWTSSSGGSESTLIGNVGQTEVLLTAGLGYYRSTRHLEGNTILPVVPVWLALTGEMVSAVGALNGIGSPERGSAFTRGAGGMSSVRQSVRAADPDPSRWSGEGAGEYGKRNQQQQDFAGRIADLDAQLARIVQVEAEQVEMLRQGFSGAQAALETAALALVALCPTAWLDPTQAAGKAVKTGAIIAMTLAAGTCVSLISLGITQSFNNSGMAAAVEAGYRQVESEAAAAIPGPTAG